MRTIMAAVFAVAVAGLPSSSKTIVDLALATPDLSTLVTALKAGDLVSTLSGPGPFTVFAPTNEAFSALPASVLSALLAPANKATLVKVLTYHVASGSVHASDLFNGEGIKTLEGDYVNVSVSTREIRINDAKVTSADNDASNGVVHIINKVLIYPSFVPPSPPAPPGQKTIVDLALATPDLSTLVTALKAGDLVSTLSAPGNFTVFAPTNEAFAQLDPAILATLLEPKNKGNLVSLLTYHVVGTPIYTADIAGGEREWTTLDGRVCYATVITRSSTGEVSYYVDIFASPYEPYAKITTANIQASNGVVHIIDKVLYYSGFHPPTTPAPANNIDDLVSARPDLSTLVTALNASVNLVSILSGRSVLKEGPFTLFAPTNEAFAALPPGTLARLLEPQSRNELTGLLDFHVINGHAVHAKDITDGERIATFGGLVTARVIDGAVFINSAKVINADNVASNGLVHIIDAVFTLTA